jgi:hypothetical protein
MYLFEFKRKLARLNSKLYINEKNRKEVRPGYYTTGIYLKEAGKHKRGLTDRQMGYADADQRRRLEDDYAGHIDKFLCGCPTEWVSEWDLFDLERNMIIAIGWRSILKQLIRKGAFTLNRARKEFNCSSLMEADYDKLNLGGKLKLVKRGARNGY